MFNYNRLSLAKKRRRETSKGLAEKAGLSAVTITRLEKGENQPDDATVEKIAAALQYPVEFFFGDDLEVVQTEAVSFRSLTKMTAKERDAAVSAASLGLQLSGWVDDKFSLPDNRLIDLSYETDSEAAAVSLRQAWGLGEKPIGHMIRLLEAHGVRVFSLSENTASVDAFSFWLDDKPYVFLNNFKSAEHSIFDAAHELGHLVMHRHGDIASRDSREIEREANAFASAFLMPRNDVKSRMPRLVTIETVLKAKSRWRVSAMAMAYRLHFLGCLTDWQYKSMCIALGKRGYRSAEPMGVEHEKSTIWAKIFAQLWEERITKADIAKSLKLPLDELEGLVWGVSSVAPPARKVTNTNHLRAVK